MVELVFASFDLFVPVLALLITVFSYSYAVKSNIMGVVNGIQPAQAGDFNITTDVMEVRWRPPIVRQFQSRRTTLNVRVTPLNSSRLGKGSFRDIASKYNITEDQLASADEPPYSTFDQFTSEDGKDLIETTIVTDYGYRIVLNSTGQKDVYYSIIGAYMLLSGKFEREIQSE